MLGNSDIKSQVRKYKKPKTPFDVENLRIELAAKRDFKNFVKTYSSKYPAIKALNTGKFWDKKFKSPKYFNDLDNMTKDKIETIIKFLPKKRLRILDLGIGQAYVEQKLKSLDLKY